MSALPPFENDAIRLTILDLLRARDFGRSICPSEAARALVGADERQWRLLMKPVRTIAVAMARQGEIEILRKGKPVDPDSFRGVYRLAFPSISGGTARS